MSAKSTRVSQPAAGHEAWSVIGLLESLGLAPDGPLQVRALPGGVSSSVLAVEGPLGGVVVKRSLARLRVAALWEAKRERTLTEASALKLAHAITPDRVPQLLGVDTQSLTIVIELAPVAAQSWREVLLRDGGDPEVGDKLGEALARWHAATWSPWDRAGEFADDEAFEQLRLRPFHAAVASRYPDHAHDIEAFAEELRTSSLCLVHGDFSPKNVLVGPDLLWVIDFEVARVGHPVFDLSYLGAHLALTALMRPGYVASLGATWLAFMDRYRSLAPRSENGLALGGHVACILLARTDGLSPDQLLDTRTQTSARRLALRLLGRGLSDPGAIWDEVAHAIG